MTDEKRRPWNTSIRTDEEIDYLNSRYLDWRGLIKKGLALKALEGMYKIK